MVNKKKIKKQREADMFAARPWLDNAIPLSGEKDEVKFSQVILVVSFATCAFLAMLYIAASSVH